MTAHALDFKRMILQLPYRAADYGSVGFATELAGQFGLDLVATFIEDENLVGLAALPFARELQSPGCDWHPINAVELGRAFEQALANARRRFEVAASGHPGTSSFVVEKGRMADVLSVERDDIVVIIEPRHPAERVTLQFRQWMDAALSTSAAVLVVPNRVVPRSGPIVAIATSERDPSIRTALAIAMETKEQVSIVSPPQSDCQDALPADSQIVSVHHWPLADQTDPVTLGSVLAQIKKRFVVLSRQPDKEMPTRLSASQGVPVLVVQPDRHP
jgi:hypothetical protein